MTRKNYVADLVERYIYTEKKWDAAYYEWEERYYQGQNEIIEEILEEVFGFEMLYVSDGVLYCKGHKPVK